MRNQLLGEIGEKPTEEWRRVGGFPDYEVSDHGRVRSWRGRPRAEPRMLKPSLGSKMGHLRVGLYADGQRRHRPQYRLVHRLVLEAFVGQCPPGMLCRHFPDRDPTNNRLCNLQWGTPLENEADKLAHGTRSAGDSHYTRTQPEKVARGERHGSRTRPDRVMRGDSHYATKLADARVDEVFALRAQGLKQAAIGAALGISQSMVSLILLKKCRAEAAPDRQPVKPYTRMTG